jgi:hypothetical protein
MVGVVAITLSLLSGVPSATALAGCNFYGNAHYGADNQPGDGNIGGIRAPIQTRRDGTLCDPGGNDPVGTGNWIGIQSGSTSNRGAKIVQIGLVHIWDPVFDQEKFAHFWEVIDGSDGRTDKPHYYNFIGSQDDIFVYFRINKIDGGAGNPNLYRISECGAQNPTYDNCDTEDNNETVFNNDFSLAYAENQPGQGAPGACQIRMMGSTADKVDIGTDDHPIDSQPDFQGSWSESGFSSHLDGATCSREFVNVHGTNNNEVATWDSDNAQ